MKLPTFLLVMLLPGCASGSPDPVAPDVPATGPCSKLERGTITAEYLARVKLECVDKGIGTLEECDAAHPEIRADYDAKRKEFRECPGSTH